MHNCILAIIKHKWTKYLNALLPDKRFQKEKIKASSSDNIRLHYYPVKIGGKEKYFNLCDSLFYEICDYEKSDFKNEPKNLRPIILHEFINDNLIKLGGYIMHWDCKDAEGKANHIILKSLLRKIKSENSYPNTRKQKADNLLLYIKQKLSQEGEEIIIKDDPILWGYLFFLNYAEMIFYIEELERRELLIYNRNKNTVKLTFDGLDYIEGILNNKESKFEYKPTDKFNDSEKEILKDKLDKLGERLSHVEVGQQITYDDLMAELKELKQLLEVLGKKDWKQILKGKLVDAGYGKLADQVLNLIINTFQGDKVLGG